MKKFIALYMTPLSVLDDMRKNMTPEREKEMMEGWRAWMDAHKASFVDVGLPAGKNKRVTKGNVNDMRNELTGYSVVEAASHDDAAKIFSDNPMLSAPGAYIEVAECVDMPDM